MHVFDASSIIHAWDNYPIENFPPLWEWIAEQIKTGEFTIPQVALEELCHKSPDSGDWLKEQGIVVLPLTNEVLHKAVEIKHMLGVVEDNYHVDGVGENDLLIIAIAKIVGTILVSDEKRQFTLPQNMARYKIPAVCDLPTVKVNCVSFIDLIRNSGAIFR
jgi:predicted nucleic acid-binding protein